jgi:hypothetical protein
MISDMMKRGADPLLMTAQVEASARKIVEAMSPAEIAKLRYPDGELIVLSSVPSAVVKDHLERYTIDKLKRGQFIKVTGAKTHFVFFMDHKAKARREAKK